MSTFTLLGAGVHALSPGTSRILVDVVTFPLIPGAGRAAPTNYYDVGLLREGVQGSYGPSVPIDAASMFIDLADGATDLGYSLFGTTSIRVTEQFSTGPTGNQLLMPWDRNPAPFGLAASNQISTTHADASLFTLTVPSGRVFQLSLVHASLQMQAAATSVQAQVYLAVGAVFSAVQYLLNPALGGHEEFDLAGGPLYLVAGTVIDMRYSVTLLTGGQVFISGAASGTLFDA